MKQSIVLSFIFLIVSCQQNPKNIKGPYLGQSFPGSDPVLFAPDYVNDGISTRDITFTPDGKEIYFCKNIGNFTYSTIFYCKETEKGWSKPEVVSFAQNPNYIYLEPSISADGKKLFFVSNEGNDLSKSRFATDIWVSHRNGENWGKPNKLDTVINSSLHEFFPTTTENGTLYFSRENPETRQGFVYRSEWKDGKFLAPEKLPEQVNCGIARYNPSVAPDESFIIIPCVGMPDSFGGTDYYISFFDKNKGWSTALNMGSKINTKGTNEYSATISPDGRFFFFMSTRTNENLKGNISYGKLRKMHNSPENGNSNIYWMKADFINKLKEKATYLSNN